MTGDGMTEPCKYCGAMPMEHDREQLARECYPAQVKAKDRRIAELEAEVLEAGKREAGAWERRDEYLKTNVELLAKLQRHQDCLAELEAKMREHETNNLTRDATIRECGVRIAELEAALPFFKSVIKSGEAWTATCQQMYDLVMGKK